MWYLRNEKGVALVTSIMFTALALVICASLLYIITTGIQATGALKRYKTALEATYGGTEIMLKDIVNASFGFNDYKVCMWMRHLKIILRLEWVFWLPAQAYPVACMND